MDCIVKQLFIESNLVMSIHLEFHAPERVLPVLVQSRIILYNDGKATTETFEARKPDTNLSDYWLSDASSESDFRDLETEEVLFERP